MCAANCACSKRAQLVVMPRQKSLEGDFVANPNFASRASGWRFSSLASSSPSPGSPSGDSGNAAINPFVSQNTSGSSGFSLFGPNPFTPFVQAADQAVKEQNQSSILGAFHNIATILNRHQEQIQSMAANGSSSGSPDQSGAWSNFQQWWAETSALSNSLTNGNLVEIGLGVFGFALILGAMKRRR